MLKSFLVSMGLFAALDFVWLGFVMNRFNTQQLSEIGRIVDGKFQIIYWPAIIVYILMAGLLAKFLTPGLGEQTYLSAFLTGAFMGFCVYGIYDLTNLAILKDYPLPFALADMTWGTVLYGVVTVAVKRLVF